MKITYLDHSGFAVEYKKYVLIFDWYRGNRGWQTERVQTRKVRASQGRMPDNVRWR